MAMLETNAPTHPSAPNALTANLRVTFRSLAPDEDVVRLAHRCAASLPDRRPLELIIGRHRDGYQVRLSAEGSRLMVNDSHTDLLHMVRSVFPRWIALAAELDQHARRCSNLLAAAHA